MEKSDRCKLGDEGIEEVFGGVAGGGELRFQLVHQGHQLIHFGYDSALFGEWWEWDCEAFDIAHRNIVVHGVLRSPDDLLGHFGTSQWGQSNILDRMSGKY